jgi:integrase
MGTIAPRSRGVRGDTKRQRRRLSVEVVKSLRPTARDFLVWDTDVRRFGVRVYPTGGKFYVLRLRIGGRQRWLTIGRHGDPWTPDTAREKALELLGKAAAGKDPAAERDTGKATPTLAEFAQRYVNDYAEAHKKSRSLREDRGLLGLPAAPPVAETGDSKTKARTILAALGKHRLDVVTSAQVTRFHLSWKKTPTRANRALALLSHMFTMAEKWGLRAPGSNPCRHVERFREVRRERFLSAAELAKLGEALAATEKKGTASAFALAAVRLLVFTGARASEILGMTWDAVDLDAGSVRLADSKTGAKTLYFNPPALDVLSKLPKFDGNPHVIVGGRSGAALTLWGLEHVWQRVRKAAGLEDVRLHDLRHSFASVAAAGGQSLPMIGALLGHTQAQTTKRYAHLAADPLRAASDAIGGTIAAAMRPSTKPRAGKVAAMRERRR